MISCLHTPPARVTLALLSSPFRNNDVGKEWKEHRTYNLEEILVLHPTSLSASIVGGLGHHNNSRVLEVKMGSRSQTVTRDVKFESPHDADGFVQILTKLRDREKARAERKLAQYRLARQQKTAAAARATKNEKQGDGSDAGGGLVRFDPSSDASWDASSPEDATERGEGSTAAAGVDDDTIHMLIEIVSATDLPVADITSTDPFVVVLMGGREVHRTRVVSKTLDPIWTLKTGSLGLISMTPEAFFSCSSGMTLLIKDYDAVGSNDLLGQVVIGLDELLESKGERIGYDVVVERNFQKSLKDPEKQSKLFLRIKEASRGDIEVRASFVRSCLPCSSVPTSHSVLPCCFTASS
jgi:hypothetical protein